MCGLSSIFSLPSVLRSELGDYCSPAGGYVSQSRPRCSAMLGIIQCLSDTAESNLYVLTKILKARSLSWQLRAENSYLYMGDKLYYQGLAG